MMIKLAVILAIYLSSAQSANVSRNSTSFDDALTRAANIISEASRRLIKYVGRLSHLMYPCKNIQVF